MGLRLSATNRAGKLESFRRQTLLVLVFSWDLLTVRNILIITRLANEALLDLSVSMVVYCSSRNPKNTAENRNTNYNHKLNQNGSQETQALHSIDMTVCSVNLLRIFRTFFLSAHSSGPFSRC